MAAGDGAPLRSWEKAPRPLPSRSWLELQVRLSPAKSSFPRGDSPRPVRSGLRPPPSSLANLYRDETRAGFPYSFRGFAEVGCNTRRAGSAERAALSGGLLYCRPLASSSLRPQSEDHGRRTEAHREIAVTDLETCCWKIPRTTEALGTAGLHDAVRLALLRAEPGQVLGSEEEAAS